MSLTSNQFKSSTIRGVFNNVDDTVGNIDASANFQRNVSIGGVITQTGMNGFNTLQNVFINGNIAQNVGGTIEQFPGTTDYNILNGTRFRGNVEISGINSVLTVSNFSAGGNFTVGGNLVVGGVDYSTKTSKSYVDSGLATKVNTTDNTSALALKADKTYVDTQLALKVNTTDNKTALALKSDKTYVDTQLATKVNTTAFNANNSTLTNLINTKATYGIESMENYSFTNNIFWVL